jgi:hypothetical protein
MLARPCDLVAESASAAGHAEEAFSIGACTSLAAKKKINWTRLSTLIAVAILVGTEMVGASWAAGWALGGLLQLDPLISRVIEVVFGFSGFVLLYYFMRTAIRHEPIR